MALPIPQGCQFYGTGSLININLQAIYKLFDSHLLQKGVQTYLELNYNIQWKDIISNAHTDLFSSMAN